MPSPSAPTIRRARRSPEPAKADSYRSDGEPIKVPSPAKSDQIIKDFLSSPSKSDVTYRRAARLINTRRRRAPSSRIYPKDDVSYRSDGSRHQDLLIRTRDRRLRYREDGSQKLPGDEDYNMPPSAIGPHVDTERYPTTPAPRATYSTTNSRSRRPRNRVREAEALARREQREAAAAARRMQRAAEADKRRLEREAAALI